MEKVSENARRAAVLIGGSPIAVVCAGRPV